ncbi:DUF2264 C-terminal domain-containing protein [Clostridium lacusfryxellense]|uniref:DUF2264 C-terminal domain-containing protein n=1 Tax=Clostridium lacusfryxellense TaxID=205328 RepID=UPI001C0C411D|nr:hypothetical protein [Clostridium lacusfryxellense]MBU3110701.1 hypothetical protein [Clostridium lacusfryxellense]
MKTNRILDTAEGAFSAPASEGVEYIFKDKIFYGFSGNVTGIVDYNGDRKAEIITPEPNTNLIYSRTIIPTLTSRINKGKHVLISAIVGAVNVGKNFNCDQIPIIKIQESYISVLFNGENILINL